MASLIAFTRTVRSKSLLQPHTFVHTRSLSLVSKWPSKIEKAHRGKKKSIMTDGDPSFFPPPLPTPYHYNTGLSRLREHYQSTVQEDLMALTYNHNFKQKSAIPEGVRVELKGNKHIKPDLRPSSPRHIPGLVKIDIHCMMKEALVSKYHLLSGFMAMQSITGEMPEIIRSKTGVHPWRLRSENPIGCKVTLRNDKMYQFLDKLTEVVLPRMKEWPGLPESSGDATGNIGMGFPPSALSLFPEIEHNFDMFPRMTGFDVTFTTTAKTDLEVRLLLSGFSMPFQKRSHVAPAATR